MNWTDEQIEMAKAALSGMAFDWRRYQEALLRDPSKAKWGLEGFLVFTQADEHDDESARLAYELLHGDLESQRRAYRLYQGDEEEARD